MKRAKTILATCGTVDEAKACVEWVWNWCREKDLTCTIDTIEKHTETYLISKNDKTKSKEKTYAEKLNAHFKS